MRPVLGIICCTRQVGVEPAQAVMNRYVTAAMRHADCAALLVPALPDLMTAEEVIDRLDGVLLTGSPSNLQPSFYGESEVGDPPFDPGRDAMMAALVQAVLARGKPLFGICRGFQETNVALGGSLHQHVHEVEGRRDHRSPKSPDMDVNYAPAHEIDIAEGGMLQQLLGEDSFAALAAAGGVDAADPDFAFGAAFAAPFGSSLLMNDQ